MRKGHNLAKLSSGVYQPKNVTLATITYVPFVGGYWADSLEILETCLQSARSQTQVPHDLVLLDNGSCREATDFLRVLQSKGLVDHLILCNKNLGKAGGWNVLLAAAPGRVIAYFDSDVLFLPGWLEAHLDVLDAFSKTGMVSGVPLIDWPAPSRLHDVLHDLRKARGVVVTEELPPEDWTRRHWNSIGGDYDSLDKRTPPAAYHVESRGISAYVGARHFQFVAKAEVLAQLLPLKSHKPLAQEAEALDDPMVRAGWWLLSTKERYVVHMGNTIDLSGVSATDRDAGFVMREGSRPHGHRAVKRLRDLRLIRGALLRAHAHIYRMYFRD